MSDNTILGTNPFSDYMNVTEVALKVMQGKSPIEEDWIDDEARKVEHKWKKMNTKARTKWLAQIKIMADKNDMSKDELDDILSQYGLTKFENELIWDEARKIKPKWKKMSTSERVKWLDKMDALAVKARTSDADIQAILDDFGLKIKEEVEIAEAFSMRDGDKRVVDAFYDKHPIKAHGASMLTTDGETLTKGGMGGQDIAKWVKGKIKIVAVSDVKSTELILKYMKKSIPSGVFEEVEEASTYRDKQRDDEKKKKKYFAFGGKKDKTRHGSSGYGKGYEEVEVKITESTTTDKKNTFGMAPFKDLKNVADAALKIMTGHPQEVKEEEKEEVTKEDQPQQLTEQIV